MMKGSNLQARPLCFIHDAILIDSPTEEIDCLSQMSEELPTYLGINFPTKITIG